MTTPTLSRREFLANAAALGAVALWPSAFISASTVQWRERRDLYPEGVASGDPTSDGVILWTRRPFERRATRAMLTVEVALDKRFRKVVATRRLPVLAESDWTVRVLVGGMEASHEYWYRFTDDDGNGSRVGRTVTAPRDDDPRPVKFAFVSCQNVNDGAQHAYRRMIYEDERATPENRLAFVLHLGDFIYELVWYPEDRPQGMYDRSIRNILRYPTGEKITDFHVPVTLDDYRTVYRAYLHDPDVQDARARFPFVNMWDNHEFSWRGWQSLQRFDATSRPAQTRKVAANQTWFEYQPARVAKLSGPSLDRFDPPVVHDTPVTQFDQHGLGTESNNLKAIRSLRGYRALRFGKHVELILTDQRSYRSEDPTDRDEFAQFSTADFPKMFDEKAQEILDAGRTYDDNRPPPTIRFGDADVPNYQKDAPPQTILGHEQRQWFLQQLKGSTATWKIWGNTTGTLDWRADPQKLPSGITSKWPGTGYATFGGGDHGGAYVERGEIYDLILREGITGFAIVAGDRHSFWAGLAAKWLPPRPFEPVGVAFITGSISAPGVVEAWEHTFPAKHPLRSLYLSDPPGGGRPAPTINMLALHGVRSCLEYHASRDVAKARAQSNPELAPHLSFVDLGGHGYSTVRVTSGDLTTEFVCIPRPIEPSTDEDGGPLRYRVAHRAKLWRKGERPVLEQRVIEGEVGLGTRG